MSTEQTALSAARRFSTLTEWLGWFETLHPKKIDFSLDRIRLVLSALSIERPPYRIVTVGGTNGKGSCVALLESIYRHAGYRVGAFTSPHLWRFNERIRLDGADISDPKLIELFSRMDEARGEVTLSYFESSAVAAMLYFALQKVDIAVLEVGMGGRLDAVNVYDADAALIVSVSLDHQDYLGPDRETIGREKAGILRPGRPAIIADADPPRSVIAEAAARGARALYVGRDFGVVPDHGGLAYRRPGIAARIFPRPPFGGAIQLINAAACITVADSLQDALPVSDAAIAAGLAATRVSGRFERCVVDEVEWLFDVAHNPAAAALYRESLDTLSPARRTHAVFGAMGDKDLRGVLQLFVADVDTWSICAVDSDRGASLDQLKSVLDGLGARGVRAYADAASACNAARTRVRPGDRVLVFGSFYTVGPAMAALGLYCPPLSTV